jgi:pimeloyl-ACP methyl ester carboxylesterase
MIVVAAPSNEYVEINGLRIAYRRQGSGPPLVLLHGGPTDGREWRRQLQDLSDEFTVVAWDMPGAGYSDDPPAAFTTRDFAECLAAFITALGFERPHLGGLSFGTGLALELYRWHPEIPTSLVLASAYAGWAGSLPPGVVAQRKQQMTRMIELDPDDWIAAWRPTLLSSSASNETVAELATILGDFHPAGQRVLLTSGFAEHDVRAVLPEIAVPVLLLYGEDDVRSPRMVAEELHRQIATSRLVFIPGAGHMLNLEAPDAFNDAARGFLRSVPS